MTISAPLQQALTDNHHACNAQVRVARQRNPAFDMDAFAAFVAGPLDALIRGVDAVAPEAVAHVLQATWTQGITLVNEKRLHDDALERMWRKIATQIPRLTAQHPHAVLGMLGNAIIEMRRWPGVRVHDWLDDMARFVTHIQTLDQLRALAALLAWRAGMAHLRISALHAADALPRELALTATGADPANDWPTIRNALLDNPWQTASRAAEALPSSGVQAGGFVGFGGPFAEPPNVRTANDQLFASSGRRCFAIFVDHHGCTLVPVDAAHFHAASATALDVPGWCSQVLNMPENALTVVATSRTLAVASRVSHYIHFFPVAVDER